MIIRSIQKLFSDDETSAEKWQEPLIELVRVSHCLNDKASRDYFDKDVKNNNWSNVSNQLIEAGYSHLKDGKTGMITAINKIRTERRQNIYYKISYIKMGTV